MSENAQGRTTTSRRADPFGLTSLMGKATPAEGGDDAPAPAPTAAPAPAAEPAPPAEATPSPAARKAAPVRKSTVARTAPTATARTTRDSSTPDRGVAALEGLHPEGGKGVIPAAPEAGTDMVVADYAGPAWHPRVKDPTAATSEALIEEIGAAQMDWGSRNRHRLAERGQPNPTNSGFREALLRLGLKHINDPEFIDLIPPDARRKRR